MKHRVSTGQKVIIAVLFLILIAAVFLGLYAWAKYRQTINPQSTTAEVAKWHFDLTNTDGESLATTGTIDLDSTLDFNHVKTTKVAPGTNGSFQMIVDTTGTEESLVYTVDVDLTNCPVNLNFYTADTYTEGNKISKEGNNLHFEEYVSKEDAENFQKTITVYWNWPYETLSANNSPVAGDAQDKLDSGKTIAMQITAKGTEVLEDPTVRIKYGATVNYSKTVSECNLNDWKVFHQDGDTVYLIYGDYLPNTVVANNTGSGLDTVDTYVINSQTDRATLLAGLNDEDYWTDLLLTQELIDEGATAVGAPTLELWTDSWNAIHEEPTIYAGTNGNAMSDGYCGYYVGLNKTTAYSSYAASLGGSTGYKGDDYTSLYWPYKVGNIGGNTVNGYWLASASSNTVNNVVLVRYYGSIDRAKYSTYFATRPVITLPVSLLEDAGNETYNIVFNH